MLRECRRPECVCVRARMRVGGWVGGRFMVECSMQCAEWCARVRARARACVRACIGCVWEYIVECSALGQLVVVEALGWSAARCLVGEGRLRRATRGREGG